MVVDCNSVFMPVVPVSWDTSGTETRWAFIPLPILLSGDQDLDGPLHIEEVLTISLAESSALRGNHDSDDIKIH